MNSTVNRKKVVLAVAALLVIVTAVAVAVLLPLSSPAEPVTTAPPQTTAAPPQTTAAPPQTTAAPPQTTAAATEPRPAPLPPSLGVFDNDFEIYTLEQFMAGDDDGGKLVFDDSAASGCVSLASGVTDAVYTSAEMHGLPDFDRLVMSWNADTPEGTWIEVTARVRLLNEDAWSDYISWGKWGTFIKRASMNSYLSILMPFVNISTDELTLREAGECAVMAQVKVTLHRDDPESPSPVLWGLYGSTKMAGQPIERSFPQSSPLCAVTPGQAVDHPVPLYSQLVRSPNIANVMCSAVTASMLINFACEQAGAPLNLLPEEVAMAVIDYNGGSFGNWSYTMAGSAAYGFKTHVEYSNIESIKRHLEKGNVIGASVNYSVDPSAANYLEGAYASTPGHLIVIRGFKSVDGIDYFICNDAFADSNETVYREYKVSQFENCWTSKAIYVVEPGAVPEAGTAHVERVESKLVKADTDKYELYTANDNTLVTLPKTPSPGGRAGFIAYTAQPESFGGEQPATNYQYIDAATNNSNLLTLPADAVSSRDFKLYLSNGAEYPGKVFIATAR